MKLNIEDINLLKAALSAYKKDIIQQINTSTDEEKYLFYDIFSKVVNFENRLEFCREIEELKSKVTKMDFEDYKKHMDVLKRIYSQNYRLLNPGKSSCYKKQQKARLEAKKHDDSDKIFDSGN